MRKTFRHIATKIIIMLSFKELRSTKGLTQAELCKLLNVSARTVYSWEKDHSSINDKFFKPLADAFGLETRDIIALKFGMVDFTEAQLSETQPNNEPKEAKRDTSIDHKLDLILEKMDAISSTTNSEINMVKEDQSNIRTSLRALLKNQIAADKAANEVKDKKSG